MQLLISGAEHQSRVRRRWILDTVRQLVNQSFDCLVVGVVRSLCGETIATAVEITAKRFHQHDGLIVAGGNGSDGSKQVETVSIVRKDVETVGRRDRVRRRVTARADARRIQDRIDSIGEIRL